MLSTFLVFFSKMPNILVSRVLNRNSLLVSSGLITIIIIIAFHTRIRRVPNNEKTEEKQRQKSKLSNSTVVLHTPVSLRRGFKINKKRKHFITKSVKLP